jgi:hypothetical protein
MTGFPQEMVTEKAFSSCSITGSFGSTPEDERMGRRGDTLGIQLERRMRSGFFAEGVTKASLALLENMDSVELVEQNQGAPRHAI